MSYDISTMNKQLGIKDAMSYIGNLSGVLSLGVLIWRGGAMAQIQTDHSRRINIIESTTVNQVRDHIAMDTERIANIKERTKAVENAVLTLPEIKQDVAIIKVKMQELLNTVNRQHSP